MKRRGVDRAFYSNKFEYDASTDTYGCPAGKWLKLAGKEKRVGKTNDQ